MVLAAEGAVKIPSYESLKAQIAEALRCDPNSDLVICLADYYTGLWEHVERVAIMFDDTAHAAKFPRADTEPYPPLVAAKKSPDSHSWNGNSLKGECTKCKCTREAKVNSMTGMDEVHYRRTGILYINRPPPCTG